MGQYFIPTFLDAHGRIVRALNPSDYGSGDKIAGHSRADTPLMCAVEALLALDGGFRVVWAGEYADDEADQTANLYWLSEAAPLRSVPRTHLPRAWCRGQRLPAPTQPAQDSRVCLQRRPTRVHRQIQPARRRHGLAAHIATQPDLRIQPPRKRALGTRPPPLQPYPAACRLDARPGIHLDLTNPH